MTITVDLVVFAELGINVAAEYLHAEWPSSCALNNADTYGSRHPFPLALTPIYLYISSVPFIKAQFGGDTFRARSAV